MNNVHVEFYGYGRVSPVDSSKGVVFVRTYEGSAFCGGIQFLDLSKSVFETRHMTYKVYFSADVYNNYRDCLRKLSGYLCRKPHLVAV